MTVRTLPADGVVWAKCTRVTPLDSSGLIIPGADCFVSDTLIKATLTPVNEAGDQIALKVASGNLGLAAIKGDIPKWWTIILEFVTPDPQLEALIVGGTVLNDTSTALGDPTIPTVVTEATGGTLAAGLYDYATAFYNVFGQTSVSPDARVTTTGSTSKNVITPEAPVAGALGSVLYGRTVGGLREITKQPNIGSQATSAASGTGVVTALTVTALTKAVPPGTTFQITGDTNTPKITFTTTAGAAAGTISLAVVTDAATVTTTIAAAAIVPVFVDDGSLTPTTVFNAADQSAGPGNAVGYQAPAFLSVPAPDGFGLEFFMERIEDGHQATDYPYFWFVIPRAANFVVGPREATNAAMASMYTGNGFANPNFGAGPNGDYPFDTSEIIQWTICGKDVVPTPSNVPVAAGY